MKGFFVTGSGTDIGKTLVACALSHQLIKAGKSVRALKPVVSGFEHSDAQRTDTGLLLSACGLPLTTEAIEATSPWRFTAPLSPDMAAQDEGKAIDFDTLVRFCTALRKEDYLLIEGVGGAMAPLTHDKTVLDWMTALDLPVLLVAGSRLGAISHTLTAAHVVVSRGLTLDAAIVCEEENSTVPLSRTLQALRRFLPAATRLLAMERLDYCAELWKTVPDLLKRLDL